MVNTWSVTHGFVARLGIEYLRSLLIEDAEGIGERLDQEIQQAVDAYVDPWQEAITPVNSTQFANNLKMIEKQPVIQA